MKYSLLLLSIGFIACQKNVTPSTDDSGAKTHMNVAYGTDPAQKMDIYLPANRNTTSTPVMILIHGGGWTTGDKTDFNMFIDTLKKRLPNYAFFNINYRLSSGGVNTFPSQENDVKAAVEFVFSKRADYKVSDKFVLLGASAGGHLALLQGYKHTGVVKPKAIVDFFGPTDMTDLYNNPASPSIPPIAVAMIVGATPTTNPALYTQSSPVTYAVAGSSPTIILQGGTDPLVAPSQSVALKDKLVAAGVVNQYVYYPLEGHGWVGANLTHSFNQVQAFLLANVN